MLEALLSGLLATAIGSAWKHFAGHTASKLETRLREIAATAFEYARAGIEAGHVDPERLMQRAREVAHAKIDKLGLPMTPTVVGLVDHELDMLGAALSREDRDPRRRLDDVIGQIAPTMAAYLAKLQDVKIPTTDELHTEWDAAEARGRGAAIDFDTAAADPANQLGVAYSATGKATP